MGLDYDTLKNAFPRLIYTHLTGYGHRWPDATAPGFDIEAFLSRVGARVGWVEAGTLPVRASGGFCRALGMEEEIDDRRCQNGKTLADDVANDGQRQTVSLGVIGQHTDEVLQQLGYTSDEITAMRAEKSVL